MRQQLSAAEGSAMRDEVGDKRLERRLLELARGWQG